MSNAVGAALIVTLGVGSMSYLAYEAFNGGAGNGQTESSSRNIKVKLPAYNETVKFTVVKSIDELKVVLRQKRVVYDPTRISYSIIVSPGQCEVFMLLENMSRVVSDYEIMRCQHMLELASK